MSTDRLGNLGLNAAILLLGAVMLALVWALLGGQLGEPEDDAPAEQDIVQLDVRNGCGESGLARRLAEYMTSKGYDVVEEGDWHRFDVSRTFVVDRIGDPRPASRILEELGLDPTAYREEPVADYYLDATLVVGCDFTSLPPFMESD